MMIPPQAESTCPAHQDSLRKRTSDDMVGLTVAPSEETVPVQKKPHIAIPLVAAPNRPKPLTDLPNELLMLVGLNLHAIRSFGTQTQAFRFKKKEIARQRENDRRTHALHALCLTCRRLYDSFQPALYSSCTSSTTRRGTEKLSKFARTLEVKPYLRSCVQYIENRNSDYMGNSLSGIIDAAGFAQGVELARQHYRALGELICRTHNLVHLNVVSIEGRFQKVGYSGPIAAYLSIWTHLLFVDDMPLFSERVAQRFPKLETLCVQTNMSPRFGGLLYNYIINALLDIPTLKHLSFSTPTSFELSAPSKKQFQSLSIVDLHECVLLFEEVVRMVSTCKALTSFRCHWAHFSRKDKDTRKSHLTNALAAHKDTLQDLLLVMLVSHFGETEGADSMNFYTSSIGSLRDFTVLKTLAICEYFLAETGDLPLLSDQGGASSAVRLANLLPPSLERLTIFFHFSEPHFFGRHVGRSCSSMSHWHDEIDQASMLWDLADDCSKLLPQLKEVAIVSPCVRGGIPLAARFRQVGVRLSTHSGQLHPLTYGSSSSQR